MRNGVINIYKERGYTSHDVVAKLRGILKQKKIGHTGTLDPEAEGVLPVCLGKGTKLCDMLTDRDKTYETVLLLGQSTDTQDITGKVLHTGEVSVSGQQAREAVLSFVGRYEQIPPMYSALKMNGQKLCDLARAGKEVERRARTVEIYHIEILDICLPRVCMRVSCSKGTYIRTLCHDIGEKLGCHGCMEKLLRTKAGQFLLEDSLTLGQVEELEKEGALEGAILPVDKVFGELPAVVLKEEAARLGYNGNPFSQEDTAESLSRRKNADRDKNPDKEMQGTIKGQVRVYDAAGNFIGIYREQEQGLFRPVKMFYEK